MTKKAKIFLLTIRILLPSLLTLLWLGFIFGNSLKTGADSGEASGRVHALLNALPELLGLGTPISHHFVRKAAHFIEFFILSILVCSDLWCFHAVTMKMQLRRSLPILSLSVPICTLCAVADECLQIFAKNRGPSPQDVLIDSSGALSAAILFALIFLLLKSLCTKHLHRYLNKTKRD